MIYPYPSPNIFGVGETDAQAHELESSKVENRVPDGWTPLTPSTLKSTTIVLKKFSVLRVVVFVVETIFLLLHVLVVSLYPLNKYNLFLISYWVLILVIYVESSLSCVYCQWLCYAVLSAFHPVLLNIMQTIASFSINVISSTISEVFEWCHSGSVSVSIYITWKASVGHSISEITTVR